MTIPFLGPGMRAEGHIDSEGKAVVDEIVSGDKLSPAVMEATRRFNDAADRLPVLWKLSDEWVHLLTLLEDPDADVVAIEAELQRVAGDIKRKAHGVAVVIQSLEGLAAFQKAEADRLSAKAKANQAHADRVRAYVLQCMQIAECDRIETGAFTLSIRLNPPSVNVVDAGAVPHEYERTKIEVTVDKRAVLEAFKATGEVVPGVSIERTPRLQLS